MKRIASIFLALVMALSLLPTAVWAEAGETGGGDAAGVYGVNGDTALQTYAAPTEETVVEVWTGYSLNTANRMVAAYATIEEATANLGTYKWLLIAGDYTLEADYEIPTGVYLDVAKGATLTVAEGVTLTVAGGAKRLGVLPGATAVNNGTILVCGTGYSNGMAMLQGTLEGKALSVPDGYFLDNNNTNFYATPNENAVYEITFADGSVKLSNDSANISGGNVTQIKLLQDVEKGGWTLANYAESVGPEVVLDLNGHTLSYSGTNHNYAALNVSTNVTVRNGTVRYDGTARGAIDLQNGHLTIADDAVIDGGSSYGIFTSGTSELTVNGTVKANGSYAIAGNGSADNSGSIDNCNVIVNDGAKISAPNGIGIYHPQLGTVTIGGGEITGHTGVQMCAGKLVVTGGSVTSTGANEDRTGSQNAMPDGAAVSVINRSYPGGTPTAEITGGTFTATGADAKALRAYDYTTNTVQKWTDVKTSVSVTGGTYSTDPTAYVADGCKAVRNGDATYTVKGITYEAAVGDTRYETLTEALEAAKADETVRLLQDITIEGKKGLEASVVSGVTLDMNGHFIDGSTVSLNSVVSGALEVMVGYVRANWRGEFTITNSAAEAGGIRAQLPLKIKCSGYADEIEVTVDPSVTLEVQTGGANAVLLDNSPVYLVATDSTKALYRNGGIMVTVNGQQRIYEAISGAQKFSEEGILLHDYTTPGTLNIWKSWGAFTLDLDGHTYASTAKSGNMFELHDNGAVIAFKNGTLKGAAGSVVGSVGSDTAMTLENVTVETTGTYGIATNGSYTNNTVTLTDCTVKAPNGMAVYFPSSGSLTISGGEYTGRNGVQVCAGSLTITGDPAITASGDGTGAVAGGSIEDGAAVSIVSRAGYNAVAGAAIDGGSFTSAAGVEAVQVYRVENNTRSDWADAAEKVVITGGSYSTDPAAYVADGYMTLQDAAGRYVVYKAADLAAAVSHDGGEQGYTTLEEALAALQEEDTLTLYRNVDGTLTLDVPCTVELNGHTVKAVKAQLTGTWEYEDVVSLWIADNLEGTGKVTGTVTVNAPDGVCGLIADVAIPDGGVTLTGGAYMTYGGDTKAAVQKLLGDCILAGVTLDEYDNGLFFGVGGLPGAAEAAYYSEDQTVVLYQDINGAFTLPNSVTLELNGHSITTAALTLAEDVELTVAGGVMTVSGGVCDGTLAAGEGGSIVITGGSYSADPADFVDADTYAVYQKDGRYHVAAWETQSAPTGLTASDETISGKADGTISGLTDAMEYSADGRSYQAVSGSKLEALAAGTYYVRYKTVDNKRAGENAVLTVKAGRMLTIRFNTLGGSSMSDASASYGEIVATGTPTRDGYTFDSWYTDAGCTAKWDAAAGVTEDITLFAKWQLIPDADTDSVTTEVRDNGDGTITETTTEISGDAENGSVTKTDTIINIETGEIQGATTVITDVATETENGVTTVTTIETIVTIDKDGSVDQDTTMTVKTTQQTESDQRIESEVKVEGGLLVIVDGLHEEAQSAAKKTDDDVSLKLTVKPTDANEKILKKAAKGADLTFMSINVMDEVQNKVVKETKGVLTIYVAGVDTSKKYINVYRQHGSTVNTFTRIRTENPLVPEDGTFYVGDGYVVIFASRFSDYAISVSDVRPDASGSGAGSASPAGTADRSNSPATGDVGAAVYGMTALLSLTGMAWTGKKRRK